MQNVIQYVKEGEERKEKGKEKKGGRKSRGGRGGKERDRKRKGGKGEDEAKTVQVKTMNFSPFGSPTSPCFCGVRFTQKL